MRRLNGHRASQVNKTIVRACYGCKADGSDGKGMQCGQSLAGLVTTPMLGNPAHNHLRAEVSTTTPVFQFKMNQVKCEKFLAKHWIKSTRQRPQGLPQGV